MQGLWRHAALDRKPACVLVVDETPAGRSALEPAMRTIEGEVVRAASVEDAMEKARHQDFAAILLALPAAGVDSLATARRIRSVPRARGTPLLFVAQAGVCRDSVAAACALGGSDVVVQPVLPEVVRAKVGFFVALFERTEELRAERALLRAIGERVEDSIVALDMTGAVTFVNRAARELFEEGGSSRSTRLIPDALAAALERALEARHVCHSEVRLRAGPEDRIMHVTSSPLPGADGEAVGVVVSLHDVTARRGVQSAQSEALLQTNRREQAEALTVQLRDSQEGLRRLAAELSEADRRKTEFLATLAHELRNPLAPLSNGVELLRVAEDRPELRARTREMMERQIKQLVRLVDDLLEVARITSGKVHLRREVVELSQILRSSVESCTPAFQKHGHCFEADLPPQEIHVDGDAVRLSQVFCNLLNNAAKYTPDGGAVKLRARLEGPNVAVEVQDNGVGILAKALPQVFDMFTQVERNIQRSEGGLGIGLALVRSLVEMHGGRVAAFSPGEGGGSTFQVLLPTTQAKGGEPVAERLQIAPSRRYRILVVDDNIDAADSLAAMLEMRGHRVAVAHDGGEALEKAAALEPELVFLDIGMPRMNGYEVARSLRMTSYGARAVLIALTGWGAERDRERTLAAGFDHHLTKPGTTKAISLLLEGLHGELDGHAQRAAARNALSAAKEPGGSVRSAS